MIKISASSIKTFLECKRKYYYKLNRVEEKVHRPTLVIGTLVHKAIEVYWNDFDEGDKYLDTQLKLFNHSSGTLHNHAFKCWDNFKLHYANMLSDRDKVEQFISVPYKYKTLLVGKMDRILPGNIILDWKTGDEFNPSINSDVQFILYKELYRRSRGIVPSDIYYVSLKYGKMIKYEDDGYSHNLLFDEIIPAMVVDIKAGNFVPDGLFKYKVCKECSFRDHCFKSLENGYELED